MPSADTAIPLSKGQMELVRTTIAKDLTDIEFNLFMRTCQHLGLDPFRKQIYCNVYNQNKPEKRQMVLITSIDGMRSIAARSGNYRPDENPPVFEYDDSLKSPTANPLGLVSASIKVWKRDPSGDWHPLNGVAYWEEFAPLEEEVEWIDTGEVYSDSGRPKKERRGKGIFRMKNDFWLRKGRHMLAKCAEAQALRKGWPEDLSGLYEESDAALRTDISPTAEVESEQQARRVQLIGGSNNILVSFKPGGDLVAVPEGEFADRVCEYLEQISSAAELQRWRDYSKAALREFWAKSGNDALELKKRIETRLAELAKQEAAE